MCVAIGSECPTRQQCAGPEFQERNGPFLDLEQHRAPRRFDPRHAVVTADGVELFPRRTEGGEPFAACPVEIAEAGLDQGRLVKRCRAVEAHEQRKAIPESQTVEGGAQVRFCRVAVCQQPLPVLGCLDHRHGGRTVGHAETGEQLRPARRVSLHLRAEFGQPAADLGTASLGPAQLLCLVLCRHHPLAQFPRRGKAEIGRHGLVQRFVQARHQCHEGAAVGLHCGDPVARTFEPRQ